MTTKHPKRAREKPPDRTSIVVVDDEVGTVDVLVAALSACGFEVKGFTDSAEALAKIRADRPDVVLLDMIMPELDGVELLRGIKTERNLAKTRVIMLSGLPESMVRRRCSGFSAFLRKPFTLDELLAAIHGLS
jgi:two-component system OmpR family response regulator